MLMTLSVRDGTDDQSGNVVLDQPQRWFTVPTQILIQIASLVERALDPSSHSIPSRSATRSSWSRIQYFMCLRRLMNLLSQHFQNILRLTVSFGSISPNLGLNLCLTSLLTQVHRLSKWQSDILENPWKGFGEPLLRVVSAKMHHGQI